MIARLRVLLPYSFSVPVDQALSPYQMDIDGYAVIVYPPHRSQVDRSALEPDSPDALADLAYQLQAADPQP